MLERIAKSIWMIASIILAKTQDLALIWSTIMLAFVNRLLLERIVKQKWTHVHRTVAEIQQNALQVQTIKIFIAHVQLDLQADFVTKI